MAASTPRYPPIVPSELNPEQKELHDMAEAMMGPKFQSKFITKNKDGAFVGPFAPLVYTPQLAKCYGMLNLEIEKLPGISPTVKETAVLAVGGVFKAAYELYAHTRMAETTDLTKTQIALIKNGEKPEGEDRLDEACEVAFEVALSLSKSPGPLSQKLWLRACEALGKEATLALIHLTAYYCYTCVLLNGADVEVPE